MDTAEVERRRAEAREVRSSKAAKQAAKAKGKRKKSWR